MSPEQRIEEAHGLWELTVVEALALAKVVIALGASVPPLVRDEAERVFKVEALALENWRRVSKECGA